MICRLELWHSTRFGSREKAEGDGGGERETMGRGVEGGREGESTAKVNCYLDHKFVMLAADERASFHAWTQLISQDAT